VTRLHVFGSDGWAEMRAATELVRKGLKGEAERMDLPQTSALKLEMEGFADAIAGKTPFPVSVADAVHSTAVLEAMARSAASGKTEPVAA
jgi:predicted dehydrogenase